MISVDVVHIDTPPTVAGQILDLTFTEEANVRRIEVV
jgi:hypothetical protein